MTKLPVITENLAHAVDVTVTRIAVFSLSRSNRTILCRDIEAEVRAQGWSVQVHGLGRLNHLASLYVEASRQGRPVDMLVVDGTGLEGDVDSAAQIIAECRRFSNTLRRVRVAGERGVLGMIEGTFPDLSIEYVSFGGLRTPI